MLGLYCELASNLCYTSVHVYTFKQVYKLQVRILSRIAPYLNWLNILKLR